MYLSQARRLPDSRSISEAMDKLAEMIKNSGGFYELVFHALNLVHKKYPQTPNPEKFIMDFVKQQPMKNPYDHNAENLD